jgi:hypothetical protein
LTSGIDTSGLSFGGFKIITKNENIFIFGKDIPDNLNAVIKTKSNGTAHGIYEFLEFFFDVRWLLPGDIGRDIKEKHSIFIPQTQFTYNPFFSNRFISQLLSNSIAIQKKNILKWMDIQRLENSFDIDFNHNWKWLVDDNKEHFANHPEWFALIDGKRVNSVNKNFKFETTNNELIEYVVNKAIEELSKPNSKFTFSLSPNDGRDWSESEESQEFYDSAWFNREHQSTGRLVYNWYNTISKKVYERCPDCKLAGYLYSDYLFGDKELYTKVFPINFIPVLAMSPNYGYRLYSEKKRNQSEMVIREWKKLNPTYWMYYDIPNQLLKNDIHLNNYPGTTANITPVGTEILDYLIPLLVKFKFNGVNIFGSSSWASSGMSNYILAKMIWNPSLKAKDLQKEWLFRAYGLKTGQIILALYKRLEKSYKKHYSLNESESFSFNEEIAKHIYVQNIKYFEKLYLKAKIINKTKEESERFQLLYDNFLVLYWRLHNQGLLKNINKRLLLSSLEVEKLIKSEHQQLMKFAGIIPPNRLVPKVPDVNFNVVKKVNNPSTKLQLSREHRNCFILYSQINTSVKITVDSAKIGLIIPIYFVKDNENNLLDKGILYSGKEIEVSLPANKPIYFYIPKRSNTKLFLKFHNAKLIKGSFKGMNVNIEKSENFFLQTFSISGDLSETENGILLKL